MALAQQLIPTFEPGCIGGDVVSVHILPLVHDIRYAGEFRLLLRGCRRAAGAANVGTTCTVRPHPALSPPCSQFEGHTSSCFLGPRARGCWGCAGSRPPSCCVTLAPVAEQGQRVQGQGREACDPGGAVCFPGEQRNGSLLSKAMGLFAKM